MNRLRRVLAVTLFLGVALMIKKNAPSDRPESAGPTFHETFSGGILDQTNWFIDTGRAPGNIAGVNSGTLSAEHVDLSRDGERRVAQLKQETDKLQALLEANTDLTRQDKDLTEQVAALTREIHELLTKRA